MTLVTLVQRLRDARRRRSTAAERSAEFEAASREIGELTARIWSLDEDGSCTDHDVALAMTRLRAVQESLEADLRRTDATLRSARATIERARELLRRRGEETAEHGG